MGRGQATAVLDSFSGIFGERRGAGLPDHVMQREGHSGLTQEEFDAIGPLPRRVLRAFLALEVGQDFHRFHLIDLLPYLPGGRKGLSGSLSDLESQGLVETHPGDARRDYERFAKFGGRTPLYALTDRGRAVARDIAEDHQRRDEPHEMRGEGKALSERQALVLGAFATLGENRGSGWDSVIVHHHLVEHGAPHTSISQVTGSLRRLEERGYLRGRIASVTNRRAFSLTESGRTWLSTRAKSLFQVHPRLPLIDATARAKAAA